MNTILKLLNELQHKISDSDKVNPMISGVSVGWHIEHLLISTDRICNALANSNPENYKWKFNKSRLFIFFINKIPRGKGKAPAASLPKGIVTHDELRSKLILTRVNVENLESLNSKSYFDHPYFGQLNKKDTIKFLTIHIRHHLKIINEIIRSE